MTVGSASGSTTSIDGLISGLNTTQIISQLMQVEAAPQNLLKANVAKEQAVLSAYQTVNSQFSAMQAAADALVGDSTWNAVTAASSSTNVTATASSGASAGTFTFDVVQTARSEVQMSTATYSGMSAPVVSGGTLNITKGGTTTGLNVGDGSLTSVINAINGSSLGIKAVAVQVASGQYQLQLSSTSTGAAQAFTVDQTALATTETTAARDAQIKVGTTTISNAANTFSNVLPGVTFTVSKDNDLGVTLTMSPDAAGISKKIQALVDAANSALGTISTYSAYDSSTQTGGPLTGDYTVRELRSQVLDAITTAVGGSSASDVGISVDKDGKINFDSSAFASFFQSDPAAARARLDNSSTFTPSQSLSGTVKLLTFSDSAQEGTYGVGVTTAATQSSTLLDMSTMGDGQVSFTVNGQTTALAVDPSTTAYGTRATDLASAINAANVGLTATADATTGKVTVLSTAYGAASNFSGTDTTGAALGVTKGQDVVVNVNGQSYTGVGQTVNVNGMGLLVSLTPADVTALGGASAGSLDVSRGVASRLAHIGWSATDVVSGTVTSAINSATSQINDLDSQISDWDVRLQMKQQMLQSQYSALEVALGKLKSQSNWLAGQIAGLPTSSGG